MLQFTALVVLGSWQSVSGAIVGRQSNALVANDASFAASYQEAEANDRRFWKAQWSKLEADLTLVLQTCDARGNFLQMGAAPANSTAKVNNTAKAPAAKATTHRQPPKIPESVAKLIKIPLGGVKDQVESVEKKIKGLKGKAMLAPMLAMLNSLYDEQKHQISSLNKKEEESKKRYEEKKVEFDKRILSINDHCKKHPEFTSCPELAKNQTADYTRQFKYWEGVRERDHKQFHNSLKITHGLMHKEKEAIKQYEAALATKDPEATPVAAEKTKKPAAADTKMEAPDVVLAQKAKATLVQYCQQSLLEVRRELAGVSDKSAL